MKRVMLLSGGTATAWHIAKVLNDCFRREVQLVVCDINPAYLIHTSVFADRFLQVPPICDTNYRAVMMEHIKREKIDLLVPLIDEDIEIFSGDNSELKTIGVRSTAPSKETFDGLGNKENLSLSLRGIKVKAPKIFRYGDLLDPAGTYFMKEAVGCGSRGSGPISGTDALEMLKDSGKVIQEFCYRPEITVDVVKDGTKIYTLCRERVETKLGVSTKCRVFHDTEIQGIMERIAEKYDLPVISCVQFMKDHSGQWTLSDFNLRSGGATAVSAAVGFEAVRYAAAKWLELPTNTEWLKYPEEDRYVVRAYTEIVTR